MHKSQETQVRSLSWKEPLEEEMATHSSLLAWKIPWTEEPGGLYRPWDHKELDVTASEHTQTYLSYKNNLKLSIV